jgi:hypothetical protein
MSWWTEVSGAVVGDAPADAVRSALAELAQRRAAEDDRPSVAEVLTALELASRAVLGLAERPVLVAHLDDVRVTAAEDAPAPLLVAMETAVAHARQSYRSSWDRDPTLGEICAVVTYVLAPAADRVLTLPAAGGTLRVIEPG